MVSASFRDQHVDSLWSIAQIIIGFGTVACMCCVLFLGLKLKWFRAQFKVQDMPKTKKSSDPVQGIGFKMKSNSEHFQRYKAISEFATPDANGTTIPSNRNHSSDGNYSNNSKNVTIMNKEKSGTRTKVENKNRELVSENLNINTESLSTSTMKNDVLKEINARELTTEATTITTTTTSTQESKELLIDEYNEESEIKTTIEKKKLKVSFVKNKEERVSFEENNRIVTPEMSMSAQNVVMPEEDEDDWRPIRIVGEKPKVQIDNRNDDIYYEEIQLANNNNSNSIYSSQAASIFFGSHDDNDKQPPESPPPPIPRKFLEDDDDISINSQTSA